MKEPPIRLLSHLLAKTPELQHRNALHEITSAETAHLARWSSSGSVGHVVVARVLITAGRSTDAVGLAPLAVVGRVKNTSAQVTAHGSIPVIIVAAGRRDRVGRDAVAEPDTYVAASIAVACQGASSTVALGDRKSSRDPAISSVGACSPTD